jgi:hypothetical protein
MKSLKWIFMFGIVALLFTLTADDALAQRRGGGSSPSGAGTGGFAPFVEVSATYGTMWGGNIPFSYSYYNNPKLRTGTGPSYAFALTYNVHPMQAVELSYTRQEGSLDLDFQGLRTLTDMSVNFWHIGSIRYLMPPGKTRAFVLASLGATYFSPESATFLLDPDDPDSIVYTQTSTKFSINLGLGFKTYFGQSEKIGLRATFKVLPTLYNTWGGLYFGSGGGGVSVSGNAIWQWEAAGGVTIKFGS